jgi:DegV family protein with EDD domain
MPQIAVVTDTDASLPPDVVARHGIRQVPIMVHFGQEQFQDVIEMDGARLFARIDREGVLPTTSAPSPGQYVEAFQAAFDDGAQAAICFCVSSEVSASYAAAVNARDLLPERKITVVDTRSLAMGQGFTVIAAAEALEAGASAEEAVAQALDVRDRVHLYAALSTLKYLAMSGRVGGLAAGMANLLNIKPILTLQDGKLDLLEKVRTQRRSWARTIDLTAQALGDREIERLSIMHVNVPEDAQRFQAQVLQALPYDGEVIVTEMNPGLSVHSGAGIVGVVIVAGSD